MDGARVYRLDWVHRLWPIPLIVVGGLALVWPTMPRQERLEALFLFALGLGVFLLNRRVRLVIDADGLADHDYFDVRRAAWADVRGASLRVAKRRWRIHGGNVDTLGGVIAWPFVIALEAAVALVLFVAGGAFRLLAYGVRRPAFYRGELQLRGEGSVELLVLKASKGYADIDKVYDLVRAELATRNVEVIDSVVD